MIEPTADNPQAEDTRADDDASSIGDASTQDSLASLRSSILDYRRENGRTYHRLSDGKYVLPNDEREQDRLDITHHLWTLTKTAQKGSWMLALERESEPLTLRTTIQKHRSSVLISVQFNLATCRPTSHDRQFQKLARHDCEGLCQSRTRRGGYLEIHDNDFPLKCDDGTMTDECKTLKWTKLLIEGTDLMGRPITVARDFKKMLEDAGFVDVVVKKEKWPYMPWPKDSKYKELGEWDKESALQGIEAITMALFTRVLDWSVPETTVFCAEVRNELKRVDIHAYYDVYSVYGQKPEKEPSQAPENNPEE
ncbi:putative methyltransferase tdiE [Colletotrichum fructicola Nara gc5]|nr:putative methyltransferase tdiE [Colletotrichum fructicola Nara gc5]